MKLIDLTDTTFTIPVRIDSPSRMANLRLVVRYLRAYLKAPILIGEQGTGQLVDFCREMDCQHYLMDSGMDGPFHRTRLLNDLAAIAGTPFIVNYDTDVLLPPETYEDAVVRLREDRVTGVIPYRRYCYDLPSIYHNQLRKTLKLGYLGDFTQYCKPFARGTVGGAVFWRREWFWQGGMENERFIEWGGEDNERVARFTTLKHVILRLEGDLLHLSHERPTTSSKKHENYNQNAAELNRIRAMKRADIIAEIKHWPWRKKHESAMCTTSKGNAQ